MIARAPAGQTYTVEEYLDLEEAAAEKSEYWFGHIVAMAGSSPEHSTISANLTVDLGPQFYKRRCRIYSSDVRIAASLSGPIFYPDFAASCDQPLYLDMKGRTLLNPVLIVEVLSPSTEAYDRGKKFEQYRRIPSLKQMVFVSQEYAHVEVFTRADDNTWNLHSATGINEQVLLPAIGCVITLAHIYRDIDITETPPAPDNEPIRDGNSS